VRTDLIELVSAECYFEKTPDDRIGAAVRSVEKELL
jgi:hypothetical protein